MIKQPQLCALLFLYAVLALPLWEMDFYLCLAMKEIWSFASKCSFLVWKASIQLPSDFSFPNKIIALCQQYKFLSL